MTNVLFQELGLSDEILSAVSDMGFPMATPIQAQAIPVLLAGRDVIGQAQTGTGKTAAFAIPAIEKTDADNKNVQTLVLCPTRELAMQVADEFEKLLTHKRKVRALAIFGGQSIDKQIQALRRGAQIVVGTPGRIMDHLDRGTLRLDNCKMIILDEADEMLDMGFRDDIEAILEEIPPLRQTVFFSATMSKPILDLTKKYQNKPEIIKVVKNELTVAAIDQRYFDVKEKDKTEVLERLVDLYEPKLCLVFCNTKRKVDELVADLQGHGFFAEALHGDLRQAMRTQVMNKFRQGIIQILVATDVAARGIDVDDIEMVINFDIPLDSEYYVHRIGRTGRAGRSGFAFSFVAGREISRLRDVERYAKTTIVKDKVPALQDIEVKKKNNFFIRIAHTIEAGDMVKYQTWVGELVKQGHTADDVAAALIKLELHKQIAQEDKLIAEPGRQEFSRSSGNSGGGGGYKGSNKDMARLFINIGRKDKIGPKDIVGALTGETGIEGRVIGQIDIFDKFSFVEVPKDLTEHVIKKMKKVHIRGQKINMEEAEDRKY
jgi:ATP-dependent RNA helicase DeaD